MARSIANEKGTKKNKSKSWLDKLVDVAAGTVKAGVTDLGKVSQFGGDLVKGAVYDPVKWAIDNPSEVAKTFTSPKRINEWVYDNLLAGESLDRMVQGNGNWMDPIVAAMAVMPIKGGGLVDDMTKAAFASNADDVMKAAEEVFAARGKNPYSALYSGVRGEAAAKRNLGQTMDSLKTGQPFEMPVGVPNIDTNELDALLAAIAGDTEILQKGANQYLTTLGGLKKRIATNEGRMSKINEPIKMLEDLLSSQNLTKEQALKVRMVRKKLLEKDVVLQKQAVKSQNKYSR
jgi:hypothetical protein